MSNVYVHDFGQPLYLDGAQMRYAVYRGRPYPHGEPLAPFAEKEHAEIFAAALNIAPGTSAAQAYVRGRADEAEALKGRVSRMVDLAPGLLDGTRVLMPRKLSDEQQVAFAEAWFAKARPIDDPEMQDAYNALVKEVENGTE